MSPHAQCDNRYPTNIAHHSQKRATKPGKSFSSGFAVFILVLVVLSRGSRSGFAVFILVLMVLSRGWSWGPLKFKLPTIYLDVLASTNKKAQDEAWQLLTYFTTSFINKIIAVIGTLE